MSEAVDLAGRPTAAAQRSSGLCRLECHSDIHNLIEYYGSIVVCTFCISQVSASSIVFIANALQTFCDC